MLFSIFILFFGPIQSNSFTFFSKKKEKHAHISIIMTGQEGGSIFFLECNLTDLLNILRNLALK